MFVCVSVFYVRINVGWLPDAMRCDTMRQLKLYFLFLHHPLPTAAAVSVMWAVIKGVKLDYSHALALRWTDSKFREWKGHPSSILIPFFYVTPTTRMLTCIEQLFRPRIRRDSISCCIIHCYASSHVMHPEQRRAAVYYCHMSIISNRSEQPWRWWRSLSARSLELILRRRSTYGTLLLLSSGS